MPLDTREGTGGMDGDTLGDVLGDHDLVSTGCIDAALGEALGDVVASTWTSTVSPAA